MQLGTTRRIAFGTLAVLAGASLCGWLLLFSLPTSEPNLLFTELRLQPGSTVAEIGAGDGSFTVQAARWVGPAGRVYSTEIKPKKRKKIAQAAQAAGVANVTVVEALAASANLPQSCCDAVFMRRVYHHVSQRKPFARSLFDAVKSGGRLAIVDFEPTRSRGQRTDHGVYSQEVIEELTQAGFELEQKVDFWPLTDRDFFRTYIDYDYYCLIFRK
jgi:predicted methyltransferase